MDDAHYRHRDRVSRSLRSSGPRPVTAAETDLVYGFPTFVGFPDGRGAHLLHVLEGQWLTQRVRNGTAGRSDLWVTSALAPLVTVLVEDDLPLAAGGRISCAEFFHPALVGPPGWLPEVDRGGLVGLRVIDGAVEVTAVEPPQQAPAEQQRLRDLLARHLRSADEWYDDGDGINRRFALTKAVAAALLEEPDLLREPWLPLDELLHDPLREGHDHHWRDVAASWNEGATSFQITDMPEALYRELSGRSRHYGMGTNEYVIALLGHLAWRTPFSEDLGPWESWYPDAGESESRALRSVE